jgi:4-oxalocrotonate tautomerase
MNALTDQQQVRQLVSDYCDGLHHGNVALLRRIFHPDAVLKAPNLRRNLNDWLALVAQRPVPSELGHDYHYRLEWLEVLNEQALAKLYCPLLGRDYTDFLGCLKENGEWKIVNKMYADN